MARFEGLEPPTVDFGDRCSTNWAKSASDRHFASPWITDWPCGIYLISVNEPTWTAYLVEVKGVEPLSYEPIIETLLRALGLTRHQSGERSTTTFWENVENKAVTFMFLRKSPTRRTYAAASITRREVMFTTLAFILFTISKHDCLHDFLLSIRNQNQIPPYSFVELVRFELTTPCLQSRYSNQLNYNPFWHPCWIWTNE